MEGLGQVLGGSFGNKLSEIGRSLRAVSPAHINAQTYARREDGLADERRQHALAMDVRAMNIYGMQGDVGKIGTLLQNRLESIEQLGGDPAETLGTLELIRSGDPAKIQEALLDLRQADQIMVAQGVLPSMGGKTAGKQKGVTDVVSIGGVPHTLGTTFDQATGEWTNQVVPIGADGQKVEMMDSRGVTTSNRVNQARNESQAAAAGSAAIARSEKYFDRVEKARESVLNIDSAIAAIDKGAQSGSLAQYLPSFRQSSKELDAAGRRMGLDVVGAVTFGALSKGELDLAMANALPQSMEGPELRAWLVSRKTAQIKLATYFETAAIYMGEEGNTAASWNKMMKKRREAESAPTGGARVINSQEEYDALPSGALFTEDGVEYRKP